MTAAPEAAGAVALERCGAILDERMAAEGAGGGQGAEQDILYLF